MDSKEEACKSNSFSSDFKLHCNGKELSLAKPVVMGILNITPDSFYDGGRYVDEKDYLARAAQMLSEGAAILDVGAVSTRPGAKRMAPEEELERLLPALTALRSHYPSAILSVDTYWSQVAHVAADAGADMINDITGGTNDAAMSATMARLGLPYVVMHIQGTPADMQDNPSYADVVGEIKDYFTERLRRLHDGGVSEVIIDPGFGFGKSLSHNFTLLSHLDVFTRMGAPLMAGLSRKSMINKVLHTKPSGALNGTTVLNTVAIMKGVNILRVHDVKEAVEAISLCEHLIASG
jgi:dihydropteroate synthase